MDLDVKIMALFSYPKRTGEANISAYWWSGLQIGWRFEMIGGAALIGHCWHYRGQRYDLYPGISGKI